jgi:MHS family proline/betaine transporter-like MFS transporter
MRRRHIIGGLIIFCTGLLLLYRNSAVVLEVFKGSVQTILLLLGFAVLVVAVFGKKHLRTINYAASGALLGIVIYGLYDEYYAVIDFLSGVVPLLLIITGMVCIAHGFKVSGLFSDTKGEEKPYLKQAIIGGVVGNVLEWYDFAVFGYFAPVIATQFFPSQNSNTSLLSTFGVFAGAYFMRPVGGMFFGYIGDKFGRKRALELSVMMMAIPTTLIGFLPTYSQIGTFAPLLLVLLRLVQGLSVGGQLVGSVSFVAEIAPPRRRGFWCSWTFASLTGGIMLGSLVATILQNSLTSEEFTTWGWRVPFMAGIIIAGVGLWMRKELIETPSFEATHKDGRTDANPVIAVLSSMPSRIVHVATLVALSGGGFYLLFVWWPTFLSRLIQPPVHHALLLNTISMAFLIILIPITGALSDILGRRPLLIFGAAGVLLSAFPLFVLVEHANPSSVLAIQFIFTLFISCFIGPVPAPWRKCFPHEPGTAVWGSDIMSHCAF